MFASPLRATCHSERGKAGGLSLAGWDTQHASEYCDVTEKMIHQLRAGMMPPSGAKRPSPVQRTQPYPETITLLESLGAVNTHQCVTC